LTTNHRVPCLLVLGLTLAGWLPSSALCQTNLAAARAGARVVDVSSSYGSHWEASNLIDGDPQTSWATADGKTEDEWVIVKLAAKRPVEIGAIAIDNTPSRGNPPEAGLRDYKVLVSTLGRAPDDFVQVELGSCRMSGGRQVLTFAPARAKFVKLILRSNHGHPGWIEIAELEVFPAGEPPVERGGAPAVLLHSTGPEPADGPFAALAESLSAIGATVTPFPGARPSRDITLGTLIGVRVVVTSGDPPLTESEAEVLARFCRRGAGLVCALPPDPRPLEPLLGALGVTVSPADTTPTTTQLAAHWITNGLSLSLAADPTLTLQMADSTALAIRGQGQVVALAGAVGSGFLVVMPRDWMVASGEPQAEPVAERTELARRAVLWAAGMEDVGEARPRPPVQLDGKALFLVAERDDGGTPTFERLEAALTERGLRMSEFRGSMAEFRRADLGDCDVLIAVMPRLESDVAFAVAKWVESGGALLVVGDATAAVVDIMQTNAFLREFGAAVAVAPAKNIAVAVKRHPATVGVDALSRPGDAMGVWCLQGTTLAEMAGNPVAMVRSFGEGRLAAIDAGFAADPVERDPKRKKGPPEFGIHLEQNEEFVVQIVAWLLGVL
jgi:hypothetical protein